MSDTPRTDREIEVNQLDQFEADWPRKLERECDQLAKQCVRNVEKIGELRRDVGYWKKQCQRFEAREVNYLRQIEELKKDAERMLDELRELKSINLELLPNAWTLEHFKSICDIKMPECAMVSGEQLLELLTDAARFDWLLDGINDNAISPHVLLTREEIDKAIKEESNDE